MALLSTPRERAGLLILVLAIAIFLALAPFFSGLLGAAVLYVVFVHPYRWMARRLSAGFAASLTLIAALVMVALPLAWVVGLIIDQAPDALRTVQTSHVFGRINELRIGNVQVGAELAKASGTLASWLSAQLLSFVGGATSAALNVVIAFFGLYYMLRSADRIWSAARSYIPFSSATAEALRERFFGVTEAMLLGTTLVAVMQGTIVGIGFAIVGLPDPLFWGTVTAFASILPVLGSALVWLPATLVLAAQGRFGGVVVMLIAGAVIASNIDNVIRPLVYRRVSNVHPMITLVGAFAGVRYFGLLGLLLGPLAIAYLFELLQFYRVEYGTGRDAPEAIVLAGSS
ncbi:MAG TPA: AI-2E family transporter [Gemmatimonadaceae bacterium]|nr:AI-2E family transporter [Gemmatimonadaceae bacterium]